MPRFRAPICCINTGIDRMNEVSGMYPNIRALRVERGLTQREVAEVLGICQTGYSKYETGENDIPTQVLIKLAGFYQTSIDYILGVSDRRDPY